MNYKIVQETGSEPLSSDVVITHLKIDEEAMTLQEYAMLDNFIISARKHLEETYGRALLQKTVQAVYDDWHDSEIILPISPLQSVTSVKYYDTEDVEYTFASSNYQVDTFKEPGEVVLRRSLTWPNTTLRIRNGILVDYVVGYTEVEENIIKAMLVIIDHLWQLRERNNNPATGQGGISDMLVRVNTWELETLIPPDWRVYV